MLSTERALCIAADATVWRTTGKHNTALTDRACQIRTTEMPAAQERAQLVQVLAKHKALALGRQQAILETAATMREIAAMIKPLHKAIKTIKPDIFGEIEDVYRDLEDNLPPLYEAEDEEEGMKVRVEEGEAEMLVLPDVPVML